MELKAEKHDFFWAFQIGLNTRVSRICQKICLFAKQNYQKIFEVGMDIEYKVCRSYIDLSLLLGDERKKKTLSKNGGLLWLKETCN